MIWLLLAGCFEEPSAWCPPGSPTWTTWTEGFLVGKCQPCHASTAVERHGAPAAVVFDAWEDAVGQAEAIGDAVLERGSMPPAGGVTEEERVLLEAWVACPQ